MSVARINNERLSRQQTAHNTPIVYTLIRYHVDARMNVARMNNVKPCLPASSASSLMTSCQCAPSSVRQRMHGLAAAG
jgi:hypothetical protein